MSTSIALLWRKSSADAPRNPAPMIVSETRAVPAGAVAGATDVITGSNATETGGTSRNVVAGVSTITPTPWAARNALAGVSKITPTPRAARKIACGGRIVTVIEAVTVGSSTSVA